ncbi:hypothetical protein BDQ12DRAFT_261789 [Crucibulum laeve]|uniref:Uncharacterized protein n=1 Tax=Crucibulum laeve TaxID=68775 RepID=A0A5C3LVJ2_9AGAR|nr:hypothetical protein BDQ12DRAFT_261789 [Crucibulum laeve]
MRYIIPPSSQESALGRLYFLLFTLHPQGSANMFYMPNFLLNIPSHYHPCVGLCCCTTVGGAMIPALISTHRDHNRLYITGMCMLQTTPFRSNIQQDTWIIANGGATKHAQVKLVVLCTHARAPCGTSQPCTGGGLESKPDSYRRCKRC